MNDPKRLRALAYWYRDFAERAASPAIWDARLRTAEDLEAEAAHIERVLGTAAAAAVARNAA